MVTTITDIMPERVRRDDDKYSDGDGIDEHNLDLRQIPSEAPGMLATIEAGADISPDGGYGWVCVACGFVVGSYLSTLLCGDLLVLTVVKINSCTWGVNSVSSNVAIPNTGLQHIDGVMIVIWSLPCPLPRRRCLSWCHAVTIRLRGRSLLLLLHDNRTVGNNPPPQDVDTQSHDRRRNTPNRRSHRSLVRDQDLAPLSDPRLLFWTGDGFPLHR